MAKKRTVASIAESIAAKERQARNVVTPDTPTVLRLVIEGEPCGKERARVFQKATADGRVVTRAVTPEKTRAYEWHVKTMAQIEVNRSRWAWSKDDRFDVLIRVYRTHESRGFDLDNYVKVCDALNSIVWDDDRYVRGIGARLYQDRARPRMEIEVRRYRKEAA